MTPAKVFTLRWKRRKGTTAHPFETQVDAVSWEHAAERAAKLLEPWFSMSKEEPIFTLHYAGQKRLYRGKERV